MTLTVSENNHTNSTIRLMDNSTGSAAPVVDALPTSEQSLLAKLEAANKLIESDAKSLNSLQSSAHSRKSSDTSQISLNSGIQATNDKIIIVSVQLIYCLVSGLSVEEDICSLWGSIVTDWDAAQKRKTLSVNTS